MQQCSHHYYPKKFPDGLQILCEPEDYNQQKADKENKKIRGKQSKPTKLSKLTLKLKLNNTMKSILMPNYALLREMAESIWAETKEKLGNQNF